MTEFEAGALMKVIGEKDRTSWEQTRIMTSYFINCFAEKPVKPTEIIPLPWDTIETPKREPIKVDPDKIKAMEDLVNKFDFEAARAGSGKELLKLSTQK